MNILIAIPIYNEERYIAEILPKIIRQGFHVLAIDDGSTDATPTLLSKFPGLKVLTHPENRGYGQSLADAFKFAAKFNYDWVITLDCDGQHDPDVIPLFIDRIRESNADIISGTRYPNGISTNSKAPEDRRRINAIVTARLNQDLGLGISDAFCGFKAYRVDAIRKLELTIPGYAMPMQFWVQVYRAGLRITEYPIELIYHDADRFFGGQLDNPDIRLEHYLCVYRKELAKPLLSTRSKLIADVSDNSCLPTGTAKCKLDAQS